jgi:hypothetical protein
VNAALFARRSPDAGDCGDERSALEASGRIFLRVSGSSMAPALLPGDLLVARRRAPADLNVGDIIVFFHAGRLVSHRLVCRRDGRLIAKGDAAAAADPPVAAENLVCVAELILRNGRILLPKHGPTPGGRAFAALLRRSAIANRLFQRALASRRTTPLGASS